MKILCYGDSNTWGYKSGSRYERLSNRWTKLLQRKLGDEYEIIEEGLNSRTLMSDDPRPGKEGRDGSMYLIPCLDSHDPIDHVLLMLGTNELKDIYGQSISSILNTFEEKYIKIILGRKSQFRDIYTKLTVIMPPSIDSTKVYASQRYANVGDKVIRLREGLINLCDKYACGYIETTMLTPGQDGVHLSEESHQELAKIIYQYFV